MNLADHRMALIQPGSKRATLLLSLICTILIYIVDLNLLPALFYVGDDTAIQSIISGALSGVPMGYAVYPNFAFCQLVAIAYQIAPNFPWWFLSLELCQFLALSFWCYMTSRLLCRKATGSASTLRMALIAAIVITTGVCWSLLPVAHPSFTLSSAVLSAVGISALIYLHSAHPPLEAEYRVIKVASILLVLLSFLIRRHCGLIGICLFVVLSVVFFVIEHKQDSANVENAAWKKVAQPVLALVSLTLLFALINQTAYATPEWQAFRSVDYARCQYMDYNRATYSDNPDLYESVQWDETLTELVRKWFFLDKRVDENAFSTLSANNGNVSTFFPKHPRRRSSRRHLFPTTFLS